MDALKRASAAGAALALAALSAFFVMPRLDALTSKAVAQGVLDPFAARVGPRPYCIFRFALAVHYPLRLLLRPLDLGSRRADAARREEGDRLI